MLTSDAGFLTDLQSCSRRFLLGRDYLPSRWRPKTLFDRHLRKAILAKPSPTLHEDAKVGFLEKCANPGLAIQGNPFVIAREWAALLEVIVYSLPRLHLPELRPHLGVNLNSSLAWRPSSFVDGTGILYRFVTGEHWNAQSLSRELHSWFVAGDMAVCNMPLLIHAIDIGRMRGSERASNWTRGWQQPKFPRFPVRFKHKDGSGFKGWRPVRFADGRVSIDEWTKTLWSEGAAREMLHTVEVERPTAEQVDRTIRDILLESRRGQKLMEGSTWSDQPMSRGACDGMSPCYFQDVCYHGADVKESGLYQLRPDRSDSTILK